MVLNKVVAIEGDICKDGLAMKSDIRRQLIEQLDVIINVAASVDFNEPVADAIQINYLGLLRILDLSKECNKLQILTHVSTSYVNCDKRGFIEEKVYDIERDSEDIINEILNMTP
jgi:alcohol-forming fatty acyl-CoA reductase